MYLTLAESDWAAALFGLVGAAIGAGSAIAAAKFQTEKQHKREDAQSLIQAYHAISGAATRLYGVAITVANSLDIRTSIDGDQKALQTLMEDKDYRLLRIDLNRWQQEMLASSEEYTNSHLDGILRNHYYIIAHDASLSDSQQDELALLVKAVIAIPNKMQDKDADRQALLKDITTLASVCLSLAIKARKRMEEEE